ncbi:MAG TPA: M28 family peptidase [Gemmatimonadales bacterium]|jgi:hypothetical protein|nr:M28 family peptidase [Gemmatimonadales bacterium]
MVLRMALAVALTGTMVPLAYARAQGAPPGPRGATVPAHADLPLKHRPEPTTAAIDVADLMTRVYVLADDSMEGREAGHRGATRANAYIASELRQLGLVPGGDHGTYFQTIPLVSRRPDPRATLTAGKAVLSPVADYELIPRLGIQPFLGGQNFGGSFMGRDVPTVWGGRIGTGGMLDPAAARGKVVVFLAPVDSNGRSIVNFWLRDNLQQYSTARAVAVVEPNGSLPAFYRQARDVYDDTTRPWPQRTAFTLSTTAAERIFGVTPERLAVGAAGTPLSGNVGFVDAPTETPAQNVIAILPGSDPVLRHEYIAIGAHADHIGMAARPLDHDSVRAFNGVLRPRGVDDAQPRSVTQAQWSRIDALLDSLRRVHGARPDSINNGADDDASGTVLALELAEAFSRSGVRPARSLLFVWHTAEEKGLYGSEYFSDHSTVPRDSIVAQISLDLMGRGGPDDAPPGGNDALVVVGARRRSTELGNLAEQVNRSAGYQFKFDYDFDRAGDSTNAYCRNDHYMYARYGIPVAFFSAEPWHRDYHMVTDEPQYLDYDRMAKIGNYLRDFVRALADLPHRLVLDGPRPDSNATCRQ